MKYAAIVIGLIGIVLLAGCAVTPDHYMMNSCLAMPDALQDKNCSLYFY